MDFIVPSPLRLLSPIDVAGLLKDFGFLVEIRGNGLTRLVHPALIIEFLTPERGRGSEGPKRVPALGIMAQPLRFMDFLIKDTVKASKDGISVRLPPPVNFALQKLLISGRRTSADKRARDRMLAMGILRSVAKKDGGKDIKKVYGSMPPKWRKAVRSSLSGADDLLSLLDNGE